MMHSSQNFLHRFGFPRFPALLAPIVGCLALLGAFAASPMVSPLAAQESAQAPDNEEQTAEQRKADQLMVVDCLLPNQVRRLGPRGTFLAPRKPIRTTAADCALRGGEYAEADAADYQAALEVWLPEAQAGSVEAMFHVGQIYERGLGTAPDFSQAARWYQQASDEGFSAAMTNLAYLYEQGLGVEADSERALNLYRRAAGATDDVVLLQAADYGELLMKRDELDNRSAEVATLRTQVSELSDQIEELGELSEGGAERVATLEGLLARLRGELAEQQRQLEVSQAEVARLEKATRVNVEEVEAGIPDFNPQGLDFGGYHALVIGNSDYEHLPELAEAVNYARRVASTLEDRYGFSVRLLENATRYDVMRALNDLREVLTEDDNLVVYYAGRASRDRTRNVGYWQPIDADPDKSSNWISNGVLADHLDLISAKHVMVVADSEFAATRTRSSVARLPRGQSSEQRSFYIKKLLERRTRLVLAAGNALEDRGPSAFTEAFLDVLDDNDGILEASKMYVAINEKVTEGEEGGRPAEFASMRWTRNDVADFFFVPQK